MHPSEYLKDIQRSIHQGSFVAALNLVTMIARWLEAPRYHVAIRWICVIASHPIQTAVVLFLVHNIIELRIIESRLKADMRDLQ